ncbi:UspA domain-containing protein [Natrialba hulunbeirensis JCM 10989]|uniref:UspA domain-containing protein n=1 Tax=Natrialba hulunbeirensis JCM 10989 TaxID=1227493 RepID=L9ZVX0_9EURY|nr:universal stress protein [Natrialba hulunbeirensis]ELY90620.1 UspA domain-containing protein [Natrialba hulunbeirensis JCM 10989]
MVDPATVLVPTLGRPREDDALAYALETFPNANVRLLAIVTPLDARMSEGSVLERADERTAEARERAARLLAVVDESAGDRVEIDSTEGQPGTVVPKYATDHDVDHVVMYGHDTRSSGLVARFLGRGVATTVIERTSQPVTILQ